MLVSENRPGWEKMRDLHRTLLIARFKQNGREKREKKAAKQAARYRWARLRAE